MPPVAANAGGVPLFTPPQTPGHHANGSTNSVPGMVGLGAGGVKRGSNASETSGSVPPAGFVSGSNVVAGVKRESNASEVGPAPEGETGREKKRRIAPTPVVPEEVSGPAETREGGAE